MKYAYKLLETIYEKQPASMSLNINERTVETPVRFSFFRFHMKLCN